MRTIIGRKFYSREPFKVLKWTKIWISRAICSTVNGSGPYVLYTTLWNSETSTKARQKRYICYFKSLFYFFVPILSVLIYLRFLREEVQADSGQNSDGAKNSITATPKNDWKGSRSGLSYPMWLSVPWRETSGDLNQRCRIYVRRWGRLAFESEIFHKTGPSFFGCRSVLVWGILGFPATGLRVGWGSLWQLVPR